MSTKYKVDIEKLRKKVASTYQVEENNHWSNISGQLSFRARSRAFPLTVALFIVTNNFIPNDDEDVFRVCTKEECVAPAHHRLIRKGAGKENFGEKEFEACEQYLLHRSIECPNPNPVITVSGNCRFWQQAKDVSGYGKAVFLKWEARSHLLAYAVKTKTTSWPDTIRHLCNNKPCIANDHLDIGTMSQQYQDMIANETSNQGERNPMSKLQLEDVRVIKFQLSHQTYAATAEQFEVCLHTIGSIIRGDSWAWVGKTSEEDDKTIMRPIVKSPAVPFEEWSDEYKEKCKARLKDNCTKIFNEILQSECWRSTFTVDGGGYCRIRAHEKMYYVHVLSYMLQHNRVIPTCLQVRHLCIKQPNCCNPLHLDIGTCADQANDKRLQGTEVYGENKPCSKITEEQALQIMQSEGQGNRTERAKSAGVSKGIVKSIDERETWNELRKRKFESIVI